jgi:VanZ family protein
MIRIIDTTALLLYCSLIYFLSDQQTLPVPQLFPHQDKLHHFAAYFVMGVLSWRCSLHLFRRDIIRFFSAIIFCSLYGLSDEWHQAWVPGREADVFDWIADTTGAIISVILCFAYLKENNKDKPA